MKNDKAQCEIKEITVWYWPNHKPIPEGWELSNSMDDTHHGQYARLIREKTNNVIDAICETSCGLIK